MAIAILHLPINATKEDAKAIAQEITKLSNKKRKLCPKCGKSGSGPFPRWVKNSRGKKYEPYLYFAHRENGKLKWCYLGKAEAKTGSDKKAKVPNESAISNATTSFKQSGWGALEW